MRQKSLDRRLEDAGDEAQAALSLFSVAADRLDAAAAEQAAIALEAAERADRYLTLRAEAAAASDNAKQRAAQVRQAFGL